MDGGRTPTSAELLDIMFDLARAGVELSNLADDVLTSKIPILLT